MLNNEEIERIIHIKDTFSVYSLWTDGKLFRKIIDSLAEPFLETGADRILGIEARGFVLGAAVAYKLSAGFVVARKGGKLTKEGYPPEKVFVEKVAADYSGKEKILEIEHHGMGIQPKDKVIIIDDWFESGSQGHAAIRLVEQAGGKIVGIGVILDEMTEEIRSTFFDYNFHALAKYHKSNHQSL